MLRWNNFRPTNYAKNHWLHLFSYTLYLCLCTICHEQSNNTYLFSVVTVKFLVKSCVTLVQSKQKKGAHRMPTQPVESARGQTICMLNKHLLNICRGLFLEFIFSSSQVPMPSLVVHFKTVFTFVIELNILETFKHLNYMSSEKKHQLYSVLIQLKNRYDKTTYR